MPHSQPRRHDGAQQIKTHDNLNRHEEGELIQKDGWHHGLCGCCASCELCILSTFAPCLLLGQTSHRIKEPSMESYRHINRDCIVMMGVTYGTGFGWMYVMKKRFEIRKRYGIKGTDARDCCASYWCLSSALVQHEREVLARQAAGADPVTEGYQAQPAMELPFRQNQPTT
ncbi:PLAC8 family-domain-containing protein [Colletotrichum godetiae]|uniref:PLAC8 family-domain-containing protein n=1 Tax=Colletotrichum godetiae TaxID=1209918 RepID=A0AAJ0AJ55_9PEZI|nr:PLAC8 family-domain-containing protein [Colletotrichum godetiae]KAK1673408.1 PLAC8 family-domain-containing protein [Colletotrichum godetiae]